MAHSAQIEEQFVTLNGRKLHYAIAGGQDRPAVLLVHGANPASTWKLWDQNIGALADHLQVFALDMPGYGQSAQHEGVTLDPYPYEHFAMTLSDFVAELRLGPATLVGSSAGGGACLLATANNPALVHRLVLVDSVGAKHLLLRKRAGEIRSPTLLIWQQEDEVIPVERGQELAALIPGSHLEVLAGVDNPPPDQHSHHHPHRLNPERFNRLVLEFMNLLQNQ